MARCPYEPHRLKLANGGVCGNCGRDVRLYAALRWLPEILYNDALRLLEQGETDAAEALLLRVFALRADFPEAHWLMAVVEHSRGRLLEARRSLECALSLGAKVDMAWLAQEPTPSAEPGPSAKEDPAAVGSIAEESPDVSASAETEAQDALPLPAIEEPHAATAPTAEAASADPRKDGGWVAHLFSSLPRS
jgi:tetratricopeptide (TPR) repeat protein